MIEAVENHMPEVIVIDEIGTELEAAAARTIAERGVQLVGTAHGNTLENLMLNPTLSDLVGGIQTVTLGDEEARRRGTQKTILERKAPPTFDVVVEQESWREVIVHTDVAAAVDELLRGQSLTAERRTRDEAEHVTARRVTVTPADASVWGGASAREPFGDGAAPARGRGGRGGREGWSPASWSSWSAQSGASRALADPRYARDEEEDVQPGMRPARSQRTSPLVSRCRWSRPARWARASFLDAAARCASTPSASAVSDWSRRPASCARRSRSVTTSAPPTR